MDLLAEYRAVNAAITQIDTIHRGLVTDHRSLGRSVGSLLHSSWSGPAAEAFGTGWGTWSEDADAVLEALDVMRALLVETLLDLQRTDDHVASDHTRLSSRLGEV